MTDELYVLCFITKAQFDIIANDVNHQFHQCLVHVWNGKQDIYYIKRLKIN